MSKLITKNDLKAIFEEMVTIDGTDMTNQEVDDFVDSLNVTGINSVDYVVEQGTSDGWIYRKWNSGKSEAWKKHSVGSVAITISSSAYGGYRSDQINISIPSGIFNTTPMVIGQKTVSQGGWLCNCSASSSTTIYAYYGCGASVTITDQYIALYAFGTWK